MIVENASLHFCFWVNTRFFLRWNCKNIFSLKFYSISSDFTCTFLNNVYFTKKRSKTNFTFSNKVFEICAQKLVWYLFETLPAATHFSPEPMGFLIEVKFRKGSKIVIWLSKIEKIRKFWHLCWKLEELHRTFFPKLRSEYLLFQRSGKWNFYSRKFPWFEQKVRLICQQTCFFVVCLTFGCFWGQFHKHCNYIFKNAYWITGLVITEFCKPLYARK